MTSQKHGSFYPEKHLSTHLEIPYPPVHEKVGVPLDLFIVHAAYSCILHPGCSAREPRLGNGWWDGGSPEEASCTRFYGEGNPIRRDCLPSGQNERMGDTVNNK